MAIKDLSSPETEAVIKFFLGEDAINPPGKAAAFLAFYRSVIESSIVRHAIQMDRPLIGSHEDIRRSVQMLRDKPTLTRQEFERQAFPRDAVEKEMQHAVRLIVKLGFMLDCSDDLVSRNDKQTNSTWKWDKSFADFVVSSLPKPKAEDFDPKAIVDKIWAYELEDRCRITLEKTDDISEHLSLWHHRDRTVLKIFHQTTYLVTQLRRYEAPVKEMNLAASLKQGTLPPQLILEILASYYQVLCPSDAEKKDRAERLRKRLTSKEGGFDSRLTPLAHAAYFPEDFQYLYLGNRLKELARLYRHPPPSSRWMVWLEKRTQDRNALTIAIVGLFLSALFGFIGNVVAIIQLGITVNKLKNPTPPS